MAITHWTRKKAPEPGTNDEPEWELRPLSQRLGLAAFQACIGISATIVIFIAKNRAATRILLSRPPGQSRTLVSIETPGTRQGKGRVFDQKDCILSQGRGNINTFLL
jgi:hypothetical protein